MAPVYETGYYCQNIDTNLDEQMAKSRLHSFDVALPEDLSDHVEAILNGADTLTTGQVADLMAILEPRSAGGVAYGADFDLREEVSAQIASVRAMRRAVISDKGVIKEGVSARDLKETIAASNTMLQMLVKFHEQVVNLDRQRSIERAVVSTIETLPKESKEAFFAALEKELERLE